MWPSYERDQFIADVISMLAEKGITAHPDQARAGQRQQAASQLLSSLRIIPTLAPEAALDLDGHARYNRMIHGD